MGGDQGQWQPVPTADARIYLVDREVILGRKAGDGKNVRLVFARAKQREIAAPARFCPLQYLRFKAARGEWVAPRHYCLHIEDFVETPGSDTITITGYNLEKLPRNMRLSLLARECVSYLVLTALAFCMLTSTLAIGVVCGDSTFVTAIPWWVRLEVPAALMLAWYQLQHRFNARLFRMARGSSTDPDHGQPNLIVDSSAPRCLRRVYSAC
ncbi:hypothetical protein GPY61_30045 [Massilia sp. NEAU-DD11]|uniref:Uncharacterized protein n=1 Tax=Massilia cellulosiltytica TaxID=2683234 RepID=A0A7X3G662_9BURK|nr:hypothetical protein [Telluria cellulosilytica]MVW64180.1 hypothetical protein [Telluria cellulosilytica]